MAQSDLPHDALWPRAGHWITPATGAETPQGDLAILGVGAFSSSITPTGAHATPHAVRDALQRYSTWAGSRGTDLSELRAIDLGDIEGPDGPDGQARVIAAAQAVRGRFDLLLALGGDNSITYPLVSGLFAGSLGDCGLITLDAHHDLRDGETNGSPVRRLLEAGLPGRNVVQIGIADFSNSAAYAARALEYGITVIGRADLRGADLAAVASRALEIAGADGRPVFVDIDVDVCDRAAVPGCPAAAPGGISADELRQFVYLFGADPRVRGMDIVEVDATADAADQRTVRLAALLVLEAAAGLASRQ